LFNQGVASLRGRAGSFGEKPEAKIVTPTYFIVAVELDRQG
jgi:hypothetical protein